MRMMQIETLSLVYMSPEQGLNIRVAWTLRLKFSTQAANFNFQASRFHVVAVHFLIKTGSTIGRELYRLLLWPFLGGII